ncbi:MAG: AI-2E family transporter [Melioribacteraceae bacterium]|nr:MAG: AI-2E family transporter [Melioribacteraceae bacterium]
MAINEGTIKTLVKIFGSLTGIGLLLYFSFLFLDIIIVLIISLLVAMIFNPLITILEKNGISRLVSVILVFTVSVVVIFFGFSVLIPKIVSQVNAITQSINQETVSTLVNQIEERLKAYVPFLAETDIAKELSNFFNNVFIGTINNISDIVSSIFSVISIVVIVPFLSFFLLKDKNRIIKGLIDIMPNKYFEMSFSVINKMSLQLGRFVRAWIFDAFLVGFLASIGLSILGIDNSITIGIIAGIGHLIPYFGPVIGGLPALIISLIQFGDFSMLPAISIMFVIIYTFDNGYIQPNVFSKSTDIHPLMIIILILMGSKVMGILGMLLAVPTATVVKTAAREIYHGYKNYKIIKM